MRLIELLTGPAISAALITAAAIFMAVRSRYRRPPVTFRSDAGQP